MWLAAGFRCRILVSQCLAPSWSLYDRTLLHLYLVSVSPFLFILPHLLARRVDCATCFCFPTLTASFHLFFLMFLCIYFILFLLTVSLSRLFLGATVSGLATEKRELLQAFSHTRRFPV